MPQRARRALGRRLLLPVLLLSVLAWPTALPAQTATARADAAAAPAIRFGVLPQGGALESRAQWRPLLADMRLALGRPVSALSVGSYESLAQAIQRGEVDMAFLSAKMALDAVLQRRMNVVAQVARREGPSGHRAVLLARKDGPSLEAVLATPERWRLARGDSRSVSGFILPQTQLFLPNHIEMETRFLSEFVGTHQATALAVANGDVDIATNNSTDFERFRERFPVEAGRLHVIWTSTSTPQGHILVRRDYSPALQARLQAFITGYGRSPGARGDAEREVLKALHADLGYVAADNGALLPAAKLEYELGRQRAIDARWVNEEARQARLQRIEAAYAQQVSVLDEGAR